VSHEPGALTPPIGMLRHGTIAMRRSSLVKPFTGVSRTSYQSFTRIFSDAREAQSYISERNDDCGQPNLQMVPTHVTACAVMTAKRAAHLARSADKGSGVAIASGVRVPTMFVLARAVTYSVLFIGLLLIFLPDRILTSTGIMRSAELAAWQVAGMLLGACGAALALTYILTFVFVGRGTPAPFDPPRRLVMQGPYRVIRNPMYVGAGLALAGAALSYQSIPLLGYAGMFLAITHVFVVLYEEPTLLRTFAGDYEAYCRRVGRWWPKQ
jgi:protein-S-isoprenylcysteine O-methyltransferase Ste14